MGDAVSGNELVTAGTSGSLVVRVTGVTTEAGRVASGVGRSKSSAIRPTGTVLVSIEGAVEVEEVEGAAAEFMVSAPDSPNGTTVQYSVSAGSASTADFTTPSDRTLTVPGTIRVPIVNDTVAEGTETFRVTLSNLRRPTDSTVTVELGTTTGTATIGENDKLTAEVNSQNTTILEGESATFVVDLGGTSSTSVEIDYTVEGSGDPAADEDDFTPEKGTLTIPAGRSTGTIQIEAVDDDILEPNEGLQVTLSNPSPSNIVSVGGDPAQTVIGANGSTVTVSLATTLVTVTEGGKALFPVVLSGKVASAVTVEYTLAPPANGDYTASPAQVEIDAGETSATIEVNTVDDDAAENTETFTLELDAAPAGLSLGTDEATGRITDNDPINVTVEGPDLVVAESTQNDFRFRLSGDTTASTAITVAYSTTNGTADGSATIDVGDAVSGNELVTAGTSGSLVVRVTGVTTEAGRVASGVGRSKSSAIRPTGTVLVSIEGAVEVEEVEGAAAEFMVSAPGSPNGTTVQYSVSAGSASTADFTTPSDRTLTVPGTIRVPIVNDTVAEGTETFRVTLSNLRRPTGSTVTVELGTTTGTATIGENDKLTAEVNSQNTTILEGESATFVVDLGGTSSTSVEIDYTVEGSGDPAADEDDFTPEKGTLTIPAGRSTGTIQIEAVDDDILEPNEGLQVTLSNPSPSNIVSVGGDPAQTVIGASDSPARVSVADVTVDEGETAMIEVKLSKMVSSAVTVSYRLANVAPTSAEDYVHTPENLVFMPGDTAKTIEVDTEQDTLAEDEETFTVTISLEGQVTGVSLGRSVATVTITDDALRATIEGPASVNEGDSAEYTVTVTGGTFGTGEDDQVTVLEHGGQQRDAERRLHACQRHAGHRRGGAVGDVHDWDRR